MSVQPEDRQGLFDAARALLLSLIEHLRTRLELVGLEWRLEQQRLAATAAAALLAMLLAGVTLVLVALTVVAGFWDTPYRMQAMGGTLAAFGIATALAVVATLRRLSEPPRLFAMSLAELSKDEATLHGQPQPDPARGSRADARGQAHAAH